MYHYLDDREFSHHTRKLSGEITRRLCHYLKEYYGIGAKNLIPQNAGGSVDLDYNLEIVRCENDNDCRCLKERAKKKPSIDVYKNMVYLIARTQPHP